MSDQRDLFEEAAPCAALSAAASQGSYPTSALVIPFPLQRRVGKIRDVAKKLSATTTARHAESYRCQVTEAMRVHLRAKRVPDDLHTPQIASFWRAVDLEVERILSPARRGPGGLA